MTIASHRVYQTTAPSTSPPLSPATPFSPRFNELQVLRAIAAALVVFEHARYTFDQKVLGLADSAGFFGLGDFGVKLFFCISGFIIFNAAAAVPAGRASSIDFAVRRLIRIVPLYWCATLVYAAKLSLQGSMPGTSDLLASLFFIPYLSDGGLMRPVLGVGWTLNFEMFFYATLAVSLLLKAPARLPMVFSFLFFLMLARATGFVTVESAGAGEIFYLLGDSFLVFFLAGMLVSTSREARVFTALRFPSSNATLFWVLLLATAAPVVLFWLAPTALVTTVCELTICTLCVLLCVHARSSARWQQPRFAQKLAIWAGDGSYSTYLTHGFVMGLAGRALAGTHWALPMWVFSGAMVLICTGTGMLLYRYFEHPLLTAMNGWWKHVRIARKIKPA